MGYSEWTKKNFPDLVNKPFGARHLRLGKWFEDLSPDVTPLPRVEVWPRGGGKSSSAEFGTVYLCMKKTRKVVLYVCGTQDKADKHIQDVSTLMERVGIQRKVTQYGHSKGWTKRELRTSTGFIVAGIGLDKAIRGVKYDGARPDVIIFDDIDEDGDSSHRIELKIGLITKAIIPSGATNVALLFIQNLIHPDGVFTQLADGRADFLSNREVAPIEPAVTNLVLKPYKDADNIQKYEIVGGQATWEGQNLEVCQKQLNEMGRKAFMLECQHDIFGDRDGALWTAGLISETRIVNKKLPNFKHIVIGVDPAVTSDAKKSDETGIILAGLGEDDHGYILADFSGHHTPAEMSTIVMKVWAKYGANSVVIETNQGGDFVEQIFRNADPNMPIIQTRAFHGKSLRAQPISAMYEDHRIHHVLYYDERDGKFTNPLGKLEKQMTTWHPKDDRKSPDRVDALVIALMHLMKQSGHTSQIIDRYRKAKTTA